MATFARSMMSAGERREEVIQAAIAEFEIHGYHAGSVTRIALSAGIADSYVFRLFGSKKRLFLAALGRECGRIIEAWNEERPRLTYNREYGFMEVDVTRGLEFSQSRLLLHAAMTADGEIQEEVHNQVDRLFRWLREDMGFSYPGTQEFLARWLMLSIAEAMKARHLVAEWARAMTLHDEPAPPSGDVGEEEPVPDFTWFWLDQLDEDGQITRPHTPVSE